MTGLACEMVSSSGKAVISGPLVAEIEKGTRKFNTEIGSFALPVRTLLYNSLCCDFKGN